MKPSLKDLLSLSLSLSLSPQQKDLLTRLSAQFPDCDPEFLRFALSHFDSSSELGWIEIEALLATKLTELKFLPEDLWPELPAAGGPTRSPKTMCKSTSSFSSSKRQLMLAGKVDIETERKNHLLVRLSRCFPNCPIRVLRTIIEQAKFRNVYYVANELLEPGRFVPSPPLTQPSPLAEADLFRSKNYIWCARKHLSHNDFPFLWKTTFDGVLAENNHDYLRSYEALEKLSVTYQKSWGGRFFWALNWKRKKMNLEDEVDPDPAFLADLDRLRLLKAAPQIEADHQLSLELNAAQYNENGETLECLCCFGDFTFEEISHCGEGHLLCRLCVKKFMKEQLFGESSGGGFKPLCCFSGNCSSPFPFSQIELAVADEPDLLKKYSAQQFLSELKESKIPFESCPFCEYAEFMLDPPATPAPEPPLPSFLSNHGGAIFLWILGLLLVLSLRWTVFLSTYILLSVSLPFRKATAPRGEESKPKVPLVPPEFHCKNEACLRVSCRSCRCDAHAPFECNDPQNPLNLGPKGLEGLRVSVENAMAEALVRTCPQCGLCFLKKEGCNKMVCTNCPAQNFPEPYIMCYLCRQDIRQERYGHFCNHFRPVPGFPCTSCTKCELFAAPDDERITKEAGKKALEEYLRVHPELKKQNYRAEVEFLFR